MSLGLPAGLFRSEAIAHAVWSSFFLLVAVLVGAVIGWGAVSLSPFTLLFLLVGTHWKHCLRLLPRLGNYRADGDSVAAAIRHLAVPHWLSIQSSRPCNRGSIVPLYVAGMHPSPAHTGSSGHYRRCTLRYIAHSFGR